MRELVKKLPRLAADGPDSADVVHEVPASANEERYLMAEKFGRGVFNSLTARTVDGQLDVARLEAAWNQLAQRHATMRSRFVLAPDGHWRRQILRDVQHRIPNWSMPGASFEEIHQAAHDYFFGNRSFSPSVMVRALVVTVGPDRHWFLHQVHHALQDGVSTALLITELFRLHAGLDIGDDPPDATRFLDPGFRSTPAYRLSLGYWQQALAGVTVPAMQHDLNDPDGNYDGLVRLPLQGIEQVRAAAAALGASPFNLYYAAALVAFSRHTGQARFPSSFQSAGRRLHPGCERTMGVFSNALVIAPVVDEQAAFATLVASVRTEVKQALANEIVPLQDIVAATGVQPNVGLNWFMPLSGVESGPVELGLPLWLDSVYGFDLNFRFVDGSYGAFLGLFHRSDRISTSLATAIGTEILELAARFASDPQARIGSVAATRPAHPRARHATAPPAVAQVAREVPASANEERYLLAEKFGRARFSCPNAHLVEGPLDIARLEWAWNRLTERHSTMRSRFQLAADGHYRRQILRDVHHPVTHWSMPDASLDDIRSASHDFFFGDRSFTPEAMVKALVVTIGPDRHWFVYQVHHALQDGLSNALLITELFRLHAGLGIGDDPPDPATFLDPDFRSKPPYQAGIAHFRQALAGIAEPVLPHDSSGDDKAFDGYVEVPLVAIDCVRQTARDLGASPFNIYYAATLIVLTRLAGQARFPTSFQSSGHRLHPGCERSMAVFSNALAIAPEVDEHATFATLVASVRASVKQALTHEIVPLQDVVAATGVHPSVGLNWFPPSATATEGPVRIGPQRWLDRLFGFDFNLRFVDTHAGCHLGMFHRPDRYTPARATAIGQAIVDLAAAFAADPQAKIASITSSLAALPAAILHEGPLTPNQTRYILLETNTSGIYTMGGAWQIDGALDIERLQQAIAALTTRHEALRSRYRMGNDGTWQCAVLATVERPLHRVRHPGATRQDVREIARRWMFAEPDLADAASLAHFALVEATPEAHWLIFVAHHSLFDGVSLNLLGEDLFALYDGTAPAEPPPGTAAVIPAGWQGEPAHEAALAWWAGHLSGLGEMPALTGDLAAPDTPDAPNGLVEIAIPADDMAAIKACATSLGASPFNVYHAAAQIVLSRMAGAPRVAVAFQSAGRGAWPGSARTIGAFSNALIVAPEVREDMAFADLVRSLRAEVKAALTHERVPAHEVTRATGVLAAVGINWYPPSTPPASATLAVSAPAQMERRFDYDYNFRFMQFPEGVTLALYTNQTKISPALARSVAAHVLEIARRHAQAPGSRVADIARAGNPLPAAPQASAPVTGALHLPFLASATATPDAPALRFAGHRTSYGELADRAGRLARQLRAEGVGPGARVGLLADRGPTLVEAMLAVLQAGGTFVTLDLAYPAPRLAGFLATARPSHLLWAASGTSGTKRPKPGPAAMRPKPDRAAKALAAGAGLTILQLDPGGARKLPEAPLPESVDPQAPAYLLFTSGTTGTPKCLAVSHRPLQRFARWQADTFGLTAADRFSMVAGLAHDPLMRDIFTPLMLGAEILIPSQERITAPGGLVGWCRAEAPSIMHLTPSLGRLMAASATDDPEAAAALSLHMVFWGGEQLTPDVVQAFARIAPTAEQVNFYGTTETPQAAAAHRVDRAIPWRAVPIGHATAGHALRLTRTDGEPCGVGETGMLTVAADELALGEIVEGTIRPNPVPGGGGSLGSTAGGGANGLVSYATGDRALLLPDGALQLTGRADDQVKIRGLRIELGDVTAALAGLERVADARVIAHGPETDRRLVAFVVPHTRARITAAELRQALAGRLPDAMVPRDIRILQAIPLLPNGKPDRRALEALAATSPANDAPAKPLATPTERAIAERWSAILGRPVASADDSFASLGGDSLSMVQAYLALEEILGETPENWQALSIHALAERAVVVSAGRQRGRLIDTPVLIRALAITLVVIFHFGVFSYGGGATTAMFLVTGFFMGRMQFAQAHTRRSGMPFLTLAAKLAVPTFLFGVVMYFAKMYTGRDPSLSMLFLTADLIDYSQIPAAERSGHVIPLWYVHALLHMLLMLAVMVPLTLKAKIFRQSRFAMLVGVFALACATRFLVPLVVAPEAILTTGLPVYHLLGFLPTTHLGTLMLGALAAVADNRRHRAIVIGLILVYAAMSWFTFARNGWLLILAGGLLLVFVPQVRIPRFMARPLFLVSGASLFIYLLHLLVGPALTATGLGVPPILGVVIAMLAGIIATQLWTGTRLFLRGRRPAREEQELAV